MGTTTDDVTFLLLGPLTVRRGGRLLPIGSPRQRAVLAALLLRADQVVPVDELIDIVWGQRPPRTAENTLGVHIAKLRRMLDNGASIVWRAPGYLLQVLPDQVDVLCFERMLARAREASAAGDLERAAGDLRAALGLWHGRALGGVPSEVLQAVEAPRLEEKRANALEACIETEIELGRHLDVLAELEALAAAWPLRERLRGLLMIALYRSGRQAEALAVYRDARQVLVEELGVEPGPELQRIQRQILSADPALEGPARRTSSVSAKRQPSEAGREVAPAQLPADVAAFTGRARQLEQLDMLLRQGQDATAVVISAVAGTAGVGKTALAIHWAHRVRDHFPDGQLHVNLRGHAQGAPVSPPQALAQLLRALGVAADDIPVEVEQAAGLYRSLLADKRVLIVLDNARGAEQVRPLLPGSPGCLVLVTSRDALGGLVASHGAHRLILDVLAHDEAVGLLARVLGEERVAAEPQAVAALARVCGLLPLALRIAAANLAGQRAQPIAGYVARLRRGDRLAELAVDDDPHTAVRTAFDCSYAALDHDLQRLFRLLALIPGPELTAPAAAALASMPVRQAGRLLERLAAAHLLGQPTPGRFTFHDLLRLYAAERCQQEDGEAERQAATARLYDWYVHVADAAARLLYPQVLRLPPSSVKAGSAPAGFDGPGGALTWLDAERANVVAAVQHAAEHGPRPPAWLLADALLGYFWRRRHTVDWLTVAHSALDAAVRAGDALAQAAAQRNLASAHQCLGHYDQAAEHHTRAITLARKAGWVEGEAAALGTLGQVCTDLGQLQQAARRYAQALALYRRTGSKPGQAAALSNLGDVTREMGQLEQAAGHLTQALALFRQLGTEGGEDSTLSTLGEVYRDLGRFDNAHEHLNEALTLARKIGNRHGEAYDLHVLATLQRDAGRFTAAVELAQAALALARQTREPRLEAEILNTMGGLHLRLDRPALALDHHRQALRLARQASARSPETAAQLGLAAVHQHHGQHAQAVNEARQALTLAREASYRILEGHAHTILAAAHIELADHARAMEHAQRALELHCQTGHRLGYARALITLGHVLRDTSDASAAKARWREALALLDELGSPEADQVQALLD